MRQKMQEKSKFPRYGVLVSALLIAGGAGIAAWNQPSLFGIVQTDQTVSLALGEAPAAQEDKGETLSVIAADLDVQLAEVSGEARDVAEAAPETEVVAPPSGVDERNSRDREAIAEVPSLTSLDAQPAVIDGTAEEDAAIALGVEPSQTKGEMLEDLDDTILRARRAAERASSISQQIRDRAASRTPQAADPDLAELSSEDEIEVVSPSVIERDRLASLENEADADIGVDAIAPTLEVMASSCDIDLGASLPHLTVTFARESVNLANRYRREIQTLTDKIMACPGVRVEVHGHSDTLGGAAFNQALSQRRAERVKEILLESGQVAQRIDAIGYGATKPLRTRDTPADHAANRRVEIRVRSTDASISRN